MDQKEYNGGINELDAFNPEGGDVAALLRSLPRVEAPANFEFQVKAKMAQASVPRPGLFALRLAAPLALILLVAGAFLLYSPIWTTNSPTVAEVGQVSDLAETRSAKAFPESAPAAPATEPVGTVVEVPTRRNPSPTRVINNEQQRGEGRSVDSRAGGGSVDRTLGSANTILPRGFESVNPARNVNANIGHPVEVPTRTVLQMLGLTCDLVDEGWKVRAADPNSIADRAGVQVGDIIESLGDQAVTGAGTVKGTSIGKAIRVRRGGKSITLDLKN